jgi:hypothetical protein
MQPRLFLIAATALLLQVAPSWSASEAAKSSALPQGGDDRPEGVRGDPAHLCPPTLEPPIPPIPTTIQQALEYISLLYPGSAANPGAVMQIVPGVMDYLDTKKKESYYEEVKAFKANLDVVRECRLEARVAEIQRRCENSLMTLDVAKARAAAVTGPADQADADRLLKLAMDQKKSDCDMLGDANNLDHFGPSDPALAPILEQSSAAPVEGNLPFPAYTPPPLGGPWVKNRDTAKPALSLNPGDGRSQISWPP